MVEKSSNFDPRAHGQRCSTCVEQKMRVRWSLNWDVDRRRAPECPLANRQRR
jgi:hypothetical protein